MYYQHAGQLAARFCGGDEIAAHLAVAIRRGIIDIARLDARVVRLDLLRLGEFRIQHVEQHRRTDAADGIARGTIKKSAPVDETMHVLIEQLHHFRREIIGGFTWHGNPPKNLIGDQLARVSAPNLRN